MKQSDRTINKPISVFGFHMNTVALKYLRLLLYSGLLETFNWLQDKTEELQDEYRDKVSNKKIPKHWSFCLCSFSLK